MNEIIGSLHGMNFLVCFYKSLYNRTEIARLCGLVARYWISSRIHVWLWWPLVICGLHTTLLKHMGHLRIIHWNDFWSWSKVYVHIWKNSLLINEKTIMKYPKLCATVEPILLTFLTEYLWSQSILPIRKNNSLIKGLCIYSFPNSVLM